VVPLIFYSSFDPDVCFVEEVIYEACVIATKTMVGEAHPTAKRSSSASVRLANACPPFSYGIVAFNGWPLNALRLHNNYEKVNLPNGKKSARKRPRFLREIEGCDAVASGRPTRIPENLG
jgi:hypothetical protein